MSLSEQIIHDHHVRIIHSSPNSLRIMSDKILTWLPNTAKDYVVVCIGTDRSTGDALGPLTGTFLTRLNPKHMTVYGTLHKPVHATNIHEYTGYIYEKHDNPFIIAIDACLGKSSSVGYLLSGKGSIKPGAALNKSLPAIGHLYITGVVNIAGFMEYMILQNTRLSIVTDMAEQIARLLKIIDGHLMFHHSNHAVLLKSNKQ